MYSNIAVTNKHTAKLHRVGSLYILTYDARKLKHKVLISLCISHTRYNLHKIHTLEHILKPTNQYTNYLSFFSRTFSVLNLDIPLRSRIIS
jgi:hypothetical protein